MSARNPRICVVGAGMSGILAAIRLEEAGISYTVVEKNADVGGTWCENSYPGCRVDTPNHLYSYSFESNHAWPQHYSTQGVLLDYFRSSARDHGVLDKIRCDVFVTAGSADHFVPMAQLEQFERELINARSLTSRVYDDRLGGGTHCQTGATHLWQRDLFDWLPKLEKQSCG